MSIGDFENSDIFLEIWNMIALGFSEKQNQQEIWLHDPLSMDWGPRKASGMIESLDSGRASKWWRFQFESEGLRTRLFEGRAMLQ